MKKLGTVKQTVAVDAAVANFERDYTTEMQRLVAPLKHYGRNDSPLVPTPDGLRYAADYLAAHICHANNHPYRKENATYYAWQACPTCFAYANGVIQGAALKQLPSGDLQTTLGLPSPKEQEHVTTGKESAKSSGKQSGKSSGGHRSRGTHRRRK